MRIRYTSRAEMFLNRVREQSEDEYHALNGLIIQLSTMPDTDNETKFVYRGGTREVAVYRGEDTLMVISIWDTDNPPHTRL
jgi:hypothetical protein